ncbi:MAG TPA: indolepyruvate ferredoxin oxidoreductase subunit alpha [Candidatus Faecivivens stercoripullorum]|uniref:Indolepyruvate oxidoreductase subunit IorA n=1 Tax=Candidatus Faecivivens stercoripullorum TaxID=2840805 RepID=A0A9D1H5W2_9FIRM|nr:indolepyruvate ferredoxin oxidoreductase subunit alpha [Candidatus Faecivivens stercoripullorum]
MKELMLGNAAIARGMYEAGCKVVSSYPGTPSTEITEEAVKFPEIYCEWAPNEKVAVESAFGASLAGVRSSCAMKHVGLNVAADPVFSISYIGVKGGMVICVADDPGMHSSQNEQDSRHYARASKIPMLEPADSAEALAFTKLAFDLSEEYNTPVFLKMCTRVAHSQSVVETGERVERDVIPYVKDVHNVMTPANAKVRHPIVEERTNKLIQYAETAPINRVEMGGTKMGIITSSTSYQYVKETFGDSVSVLKLGMIWPLPEKLIRDFAAKVEKLVVVEELDPFIEEHCKKLGLEVHGKDILPMCDEFSQNLLAEKFGLPVPASRSLDENIPVRPPVMCSGCPHRGMFYTLMKQNCTVIGDIGCYTLGSAAPLLAMDINICMGASVSAEHGFNVALGKASQNKTVSVIGDSTFVHSGMTSLANIAYNQSASTVIILDNSITGMTGHQQNPTTGYNIKGDPAGKIDLEALCHAMGINRVRVVDPYDLAECDKAVREELAVDEPSVIISRRPCVLLKSVKTAPPLHVDTDKCRGCKACMKMGCPSISIRNGKAVIDETLCVGCGVCQQLCHFDALVR